MKKVYIVECASGEYDSFHWWIGGVFDDKKLAEDLANKLDLEAKNIIANCPAVNEDSNQDDKDIYWEYYFKHKTQIDWHYSKVIEYDLNQEIKHDN